MKIAYLSNGFSIHDYRIVRKMVERGHMPYFISYWPAKVEFSIKGVEFIHYDPRLPRLPKIIFHLRRILNEIRPDVLHTGYVQTNGFYGALSGFHPILLMPWGSDILIESDRSLWKRMITKYVIRRADIIQCDCQLVKDKIIVLTNYPQEKIVIFPQGMVNLSIFKPSKDSYVIRERLGWRDKKILIMTRNFKPIYGIEYFINALPQVIRERPETRAILVGSGPLEGMYRQKVKELGLNDYVHFAGEANEVEMAKLLNTADIYVTTSLSDGTSGSMLEAMACGLPVVVSDAPAYFEWVEDGVNGYIIRRKDVVQLAERLMALLDDKAQRQAMGQRNLRIARERADWEKNFTVLEGIYQQLIT